MKRQRSSGSSVGGGGDDSASEASFQACLSDDDNGEEGSGACWDGVDGSGDGVMFEWSVELLCGSSEATATLFTREQGNDDDQDNDDNADDENAVGRNGDVEDEDAVSVGGLSRSSSRGSLGRQSDSNNEWVVGCGCNAVVGGGRRDKGGRGGGGGGSGSKASRSKRGGGGGGIRWELMLAACRHFSLDLEKPITFRLLSSVPLSSSSPSPSLKLKRVGSGGNGNGGRNSGRNSAEKSDKGKSARSARGGAVPLLEDDSALLNALGEFAVPRRHQPSPQRPPGPHTLDELREVNEAAFHHTPADAATVTSVTSVASAVAVSASKTQESSSDKPRSPQPLRRSVSFSMVAGSAVPVEACREIDASPSAVARTGMERAGEAAPTTVNCASGGGGADDGDVAFAAPSPPSTPEFVTVVSRKSKKQKEKKLLREPLIPPPPPALPQSSSAAQVVLCPSPKRPSALEAIAWTESIAAALVNSTNNTNNTRAAAAGPATPPTSQQDNDGGDNDNAMAPPPPRVVLGGRGSSVQSAGSGRSSSARSASSPSSREATPSPQTMLPLRVLVWGERASSSSAAMATFPSYSSLGRSPSSSDLPSSPEKKCQQTAAIGLQASPHKRSAPDLVGLFSSVCSQCRDRAEKLLANAGNNGVSVPESSAPFGSIFFLCCASEQTNEAVFIYKSLFYIYFFSSLH